MAKEVSDVFEIGSLVVYGVSGVCRVQDRKIMSFSGDEKEYFVLSPLSSAASVIYVPLSNEKLVSKMKPVMTADEINRLIKELPEHEDVWDDDSSVRKERIKAILDSGDRVMQIRLIRTLWRKKKEREAQGKKLWAFEEHAMNAAEKNLCDEFRAVLGIRPDQVVRYIGGETDDEEG